MQIITREEYTHQIDSWIRKEQFIVITRVSGYWYFPYVVCFSIFHVVVRLLREDSVLFQGTRIVSLHRWKFPLVNGGFHKLRTKCS